MPFYETVFIARQDLGDQQVKDLIEQFSKVITENGGKIHKTEHWGLRTLAYRIKKSRRAHYALIESDTPAPAIHEMERRMRINEDILRYLTTRQETLSTGPSVILGGSRDDHSDNTQSEDKEAA